MVDLIVQRPEGLYCPPGNFYIDPWRPVERAVITHAHSDHARYGSGHYLASAPAEGVLRTRFEPVRCDTFITESTFGLPIYRWCPDDEIFADINAWWARNASHARASVLTCYSFGKAQRVLSGVDASIGPIIVHGAVEPLNRAYRAGGIALPDTRMVTDVKEKADLRRCLVVCPPSAAASPWMRRFGEAQTAFASGWMQVRGNRRRGGYDRGFVLSDHADWPGLMGAIEATGAQRVIVTHGSVPVMVRHLRERGLQAEAFETEYGDDVVEADLQAGQEGA
jgi:putative mRNA 3-end processing factor